MIINLDIFIKRIIEKIKVSSQFTKLYCKFVDELNNKFDFIEKLSTEIMKDYCGYLIIIYQDLSI